MPKLIAVTAAASVVVLSGTAHALTVPIDLNTTASPTYDAGEWQLKTQGLTFHGLGPISLNSGKVVTLDQYFYDEGPGWVTFEQAPFVVKNVSFDLFRVKTGIYCSPFTAPQVCSTDNSISATAYDTLGNLVGTVSSLSPTASADFSSGIGIGRIDWTGTTPFDGRYLPSFYGQGSLLGNLVISDTVPEPATWALMLVGFGGIGYTMRRRKVAVSFS